MINKLSNELTEEKQKSKNNQQVIVNPVYNFPQEQFSSIIKSSSLSKNTSGSSSRSSCPQKHYSNKIYLTC